MLTWGEINTGWVPSLWYHFGEWLINDDFSCCPQPSCSETKGWVTWSCEPMEWKNPSGKVVLRHGMLAFIFYKWANSFLTYTSGEPCIPFTVQEHAAAQEVFPCLEHFRRLRLGQGFGEGYDFASRGVNLSLPFQGLWHIARDNASCWKYKRSQEAHGTTTKNRTADLDIADILGAREANVLMLLMVLNLTHGMVIITSTKCPHLHLLVWRYRYAFWYEVGEVSRKCCFMH